jgi:hypothetical protein
MSNPLAIAAVTATLRHLLDRGLGRALPGTTVTTRPLDKAREQNSGNQINLFLYQTMPNAAWRNIDPGLGPSGDAAQPPLALTLYYLLTVYGQNEDDSEPFSHRLLGLAMDLFHQHPILAPCDIRDALAGNDLYQQVQRIRISFQPLLFEEMSKIWATFQTQYRLSVAYEVSVVLIDSRRQTEGPP